jgi:hypothetical protein
MANDYTNRALDVPATFANLFQVLVAGPNVRVAFAEGFAGQDPNYRFAVAMSVEDARTLAYTILGNLPPQPQQGNALTGVLGIPTPNPLFPGNR